MEADHRVDLILMHKHATERLAAVPTYGDLDERTVHVAAAETAQPGREQQAAPAMPSMTGLPAGTSSLEDVRGR